LQSVEAFLFPLRQGTARTANRGQTGHLVSRKVTMNKQDQKETGNAGA
jgi:hypothetical protein